MLESNKRKLSVIIWGIGGFWKEKREYIEKEYEVVAYMDSYKTGLFEGKHIILGNELKEYKYDKIIVMVSYIEDCFYIVRKLVNEFNVVCENIILGLSIYGNIKCITPECRFVIEENNLSISVGSMAEYLEATMALRGDDFHFYLNEKSNVIMDIGMNIGDSTMYFLSNKTVKKVYGYEPFSETYIHAENNLKEYIEKENERISLHNYGLSDANRMVEALYNEDMSTGLSSDVGNVEKGYKVYDECGVGIRIEQERKEKIKLVDVAEEFKRVMSNHSDCNYILKIDCEGEEYNILQRLSETHLLEKVSYVIIEWHYKGKDILLEQIKKFGFSYNYRVTSFKDDMGMIYGTNLKLLS